MEQENPATSIQKRPGLSEILGAGFVIIGILTFFAVVSHQYNMARGIPGTTNMIGAFGHYTAGYLTFLFGNGGLFMGPYLVLMGLMGIYRGAMEDPVPRIAALPFLLVSLSMILSLFFDYRDGGLVGQAVASGLSFAFGGFGTGVLSAGVFATAVIISLRLPVPVLVQNISSSLDRLLPRGIFRSTGDYVAPVQNEQKDRKDPQDKIDLSALDELAEKEKQSGSYQVAPGVTINIGGTGMADQKNDSSGSFPFFSKGSGERKPWFEKVEQELNVDDESIENHESRDPSRESEKPQPGPIHRNERKPVSPDLTGRIRNLQYTLSRIAEKKKNEELMSDLSFLKGQTDETSHSGIKTDDPVMERDDDSGESESGRLPDQNKRFSMDYQQVSYVSGGKRNSGLPFFEGNFNRDETRFHFRNHLFEPGKGKNSRNYFTVENPSSTNEAPGPSRSLLKTIDISLLEKKQERLDLKEEESFRGEEFLREEEFFRFEKEREPNSSGIDVDSYLVEAREIPESERINSDLRDDDSFMEDGDPVQREDSPEDEKANREPLSELEQELKWDQKDEEDESVSSESRNRDERSVEPFFSEIPPFRLRNGRYRLPPEILHLPEKTPQEDLDREIAGTRNRLENVMRDYGIQASVVRTQRGPIITLYEIKLEPGTRVNKILGIYDEIKMNLEAASLRIVAPIPGKSTIGIEIPNRIRDAVALGEIIRKDKSFFSTTRELGIVLGKDISGANQYVELTRLPHLLIAGATGAGKSVYMNSVIASLLYQRSPEELRFIMIDPKMVELKLFEGIPHLIMPVLTDAKAASKALTWVVQEMERRYTVLSRSRSREIRSYNERVSQSELFQDHETSRKMPYLVVVIDELADLMMVAAKDVEDSIIRLTQKARAVGIHIIMATQRPSVDVITALIKANCPARISFHVAQRTDSRTILDSNGAETLLGRGDMLYKSPTSTATTRIQAPLITEQEIEKIVRETRRFGEPVYVDLPLDENGDSGEEGDNDDDDLFDQAWRIVQETGKTSTSYIQRRLRIGYNRAANLIEEMEDRGYLSAAVGNRPREILKRS